MKARHIFVLLVTSLLLSATSGCMVYPPEYPQEPSHNRPPPAIFQEPSYLYLLSDYGVYFIPDISADIFYYSGKWYYRLGTAWHWAFNYNGPWVYIEASNIPRVMRQIPFDHRHPRYANRYNKVPYGHWKKRIEEPPKAKFQEPPYLYRIPNLNVYFVPEETRELFLYKNRWFHRNNGIWYWGRNHEGPWTYMEIDKVPKDLRKLPENYRERSREYDKKVFRKKKSKKGHDED